MIDKIYRENYKILGGPGCRKTTKLLENFLQDFQLTKKENYFVINLSDNGISKIIQSTMNQAIEIVRRRIDESGTKEPLIQQQGKDRILVQLPGVDDPGRIKRLLGKTAKLTFRFTHPKINSSELNKNFVSPPGYILLEDQNDKEKFEEEPEIEQEFPDYENKEQEQIF